MVTFLGWLNISLVAFKLLPFLTRRLDKYVYKNKNKSLRNASKHLAKIHPITGILFIIIAGVHGYIALDTIRLHTGYIALFMGLLLFIVAGVGMRYKFRWWVKVHRSLAILLAVSILIHLFARNLF